MKKNIFTLFALSLSTSLWSMSQTVPTQNHLEAARAKWITWAHENVKNEKIKLLGLFGLSLNSLDNPKIIEQIYTIQRETIANKPAVKRPALANLARSLIAPPKEIEIVEKIAKKIFINRLITVVHEKNFPWHDMSIHENYTDKTLRLTMNVTEHIKNPELLENLMQHEYCHIINSDQFNTNLIMHVAYANSSQAANFNQEYTEKSIPYSHAIELRADVYAACNSLDHGASLIIFFKQCPQNNIANTHPHPTVRIDLLTKVHADLTKAAQLDTAVHRA